MLREFEFDQTGVLEMTVIVSVVADKSITTSKELGGTKAGKPVRIKAVQNGKYLLAENESGIAPENITVKRVGKNLHVALEGRDPDQPELIIEEFFSNEGQLVGLAEDGAYHEYIAVDGNGDSDAAFLLEGVSSPLALGSGELLGFGDGLVVAGGGMLPWLLAGLGLAGAGVAIGNHNSGGKKPVVDTTPPDNKGIGQVVDDKGPVQGNIEKGGITDDDRPTLGGKGQEPGDTVTIIDNGKVIGEVVVDKDGAWTFTPEKDLADGEHSFEVVITDPEGNASEPSDDFTVIIDTTPPVKPGANDAQLIDDAGAIVGPIVSGTVTDDNTPTYKGKAEPNATVVIYDNDKEIGRAQTNAAGDWTFTPSKPLTDGAHSLNYQVIDKAGNVGEKSDVIDFTVDTVPPTKPGANEAQLIDDEGAIVGPIVSGSTTDDTTPTYKGKSEPNATVVIHDNGKEIGRAQTNGNGDWTFTPSTPLADGPHSLNYQVIDKAGNVGEKSDAIDFTVDTFAPANPTIDSVHDDQGLITGNLVSGAETDDAKPEISGTAEAGSTVIIRDNGVEIGRATANAAGEWSFEPKLPLGLGNHSLTATAVDAAGNVSKPSNTFELTLVDPGMPPAPAITAVVDDVGATPENLQKDGITNDARPTVEGTAQAGTTVSVYSNGTLLGTVLVGATGAWKFTPSNDLADGLHNIHATATNSVGNVSPETGLYPINVDTQAPDVGTAALFDDAGQRTGEIVSGDTTDDTTPTLKGKAEAGATIVIYGNNDEEIGRTTVDAGGDWIFSPSVPLEDGNYEFSYEVIDKAGNVSERSPDIAFEVETGSIEARISSINDQAGSSTGIIPIGGVTDDATPELRGSATAGGTVKIYEGLTLLGETVANAQGIWSFTPLSPLSEGAHELHVTVTTVVMGESEPSDIYGFTVDLTAPTQPSITDISDDVGTIKGVISQGASTDDTTPTLKGKAEAGSTVHIFDGANLLASVTADAKGEWSYTVSPPLGNGPHDFTVTSEDKAGNVSEPSDAYGVVIDTVPPAKPIIDTVHDDQGNQTGNLASGDSTDDASPTISGSAEPGSTVVIYDNGKKIGDAEVGADGKWTFEPALPLSPGGHKLTVEAVDAAGNASAPSDAFDLVVGTSEMPDPPAITGVIDDVGSVTGNIQKEGITDDPRPTINGTAQAGMVVSVYIDGKLAGTAPVNTDGSWTFTPSADLADGPHKIKATSTNALGNVSPETGDYPFVVDTVRPSKPGSGDAQLWDDEGQITGEIVNGGPPTDDSTPTFKGNAEPDSTVVIYDNGKVIGEAPTDKNGDWTFTPTTPLVDGDHSLSYEVVDKAGNVSEKSDPIDFNVNTRDVVIKIDGADDNVGKLTGAISNGGMTDDATPTLHGKATAGGIVKIYEGSELLGQAIANAEGKWSLELPNGLSEGAHSLTATVTTEANGESTQTPAFNLTVDLTAPTKPSITEIGDDVGSVQGPIGNGASTDDTTPTLKGQAEANSTVHIHDNGKLIGSVQAGSNGLWSFTPTTPLIGGTHDFTVTSEDKAGNVSAPSDAYGVVIDTVAPAQPTIDSVYDDQGNQTGELTSGDSTDDASPTISGSAEPGSTVVIYDNGKKIGDAEVGADGKWTFEPKLPLGLGDHKLTVEAVDAAGNTSVPSDAFDLTLGNADKPNPPAITNVIDDVGSVTGSIQKDGITDDARPTVNGTAQAGMTVSVYIDGKLAGTAPVDAEGNWSFTPSADLADGPHYINATSTNSLGNVSPETGDYPFVVDTAAPGKPGNGDAELIDDEGSITGPITNGSVTDDSTPTFNGKAEPDSTVVIYDNDKNIGEAIADENGDWTFTPTTPLDDGDHSLSYEVVDKAGNVSEKSDPIDFTVDSSIVTVRIDGANDNVGKLIGAISNGGMTDDATPTLHGKATAGGIVKIYEGDVLLGQATADIEGKWSLELPNALSEGAHALTATVTTGTSAESVKTPAFNLTVDLTAPTKPSITEIGDDVGSVQGPIGNGASTDDTTPTLKGQAEANSTVHIHDNGKLIGSVQAGSNGLWNFTPTTPLIGGVHDFTVTSEDKAGNVSAPSDVHGVVVDTIPPAKPIIETVEDDQGSQTGNLASGDSTDDTKPTINGSGEPNSTVVIYDDGKKIGEAEVGADGKWTFEPSEPLLDGKHDLTVVNVDRAGNESAPSDVFTLITDTVSPVKPQITAVIDSEGAKQGQLAMGEVTDDLQPEISGTAEANSTVLIWDNGQRIGQALADANGDWTFVPANPLQLGLHAVHVTSVDKVGNVSEPSDAFDFSINRELPSQPAIKGIIDAVGEYVGNVLDGSFTDDTKPVIYGNGTAGETIQIRVDGVVAGTTVVAENGTWKVKSEIALTDGLHAFTAVSLSAAGVPSEVSAQYSVQVDTVNPDAPTVLSVYDDVGAWKGNLTDGQYTDDRRPLFNGKAESFAKIVVYDNGEEVGQAGADADGNWSWIPEANLKYGEHVFEFEAIDRAGNISETGEWVVHVGNITRALPPVDGSAEPLSLQDLLMAGDSDVLVGSMDAPVQMAPVQDLDLQVAANEWVQAADSFNDVSTSGMSTVAPIMQDSMHQLENQLIG
ncbi:hypothetical protein D3C81_273700 [compost metagenome]